MEPLDAPPCPWLLDPGGAIYPAPSLAGSRCGAETHRPELPKSTRAERCYPGGSCPIRQAREAELGVLAGRVAPRLPIGDASLLAAGAAPRRPRGLPIRRVVLVLGLAALITVASGPVATVVGPLVASIAGAITAPGAATPTPSAEGSPTALPSPSEGGSPSPSAPPSPSPSPTPAPSSSAVTSKTYVVQRGDTLYDIAMSLGLGPDGYKEIAALNNIAGPSYVIAPGQVLTLP